MAGLDRGVIDELQPDLALRRIRRDVKSDFIFAPHLDAIYAYIGDELWDRLKESLGAGQYEPKLSISLEAPKPTGITRPGTILLPDDRLLYQALVDLLAPTAAAELDPNRSFSHRLVENSDTTGEMFQPHQNCWDKLLCTVRDYCNMTEYGWAVRADVAAFFDNIDQHALVNLLHASGCQGGALNLLEELLSSWRERSSRGILQGMFPSDFLGNFYLCGLDGQLEVEGVPSARYVDDIYLFYTSQNDARDGLANLCRFLRRDGLYLNERKTALLRAEELLHEETYVDRLFSDAREAAEQQAFGQIDSYILHSMWDYEDPWEFVDEEEVELKAFEELFESVDEPEVPADKVERLCIPFFAAVRSPIAVARALEGIATRPHQSKLYASYLSSIACRDGSITKEIENIWNANEIVYDWQKMWLAASLWFLPQVTEASVRTALKMLNDPAQSEAVRAVCVQVVAKHGAAAFKRALRGRYSDEPSAYVRASLLFAAQYFSGGERRALLRAWGGHSATNALVAQVVRFIGRKGLQ